MKRWNKRYGIWGVRSLRLRQHQRVAGDTARRLRLKLPVLRPLRRKAPGVAKIGIEDFAKVEMLVGQVKSAEKVAGADKLLKVMVDVGDEVRQIVAGIATAYRPEELVGRKVVVVANLTPRKLRGVESNGMLLAASTAEGKPVLCTFAEEVPVGSRLK